MTGTTHPVWIDKTLAGWAKFSHRDGAGQGWYRPLDAAGQPIGHGVASFRAAKARVLSHRKSLEADK